MTLHSYNLKHDLAEISQPWKDGYEIIYENGTIAWCPKDIYELSIIKQKTWLSKIWNSIF